MIQSGYFGLIVNNWSLRISKIQIMWITSDVRLCLVPRLPVPRFTFPHSPERIEYKLLSLTYKVLTTSQPPNLRTFITSSLFNVLALAVLARSLTVNLARPPTSSSLKITDRPLSPFGMLTMESTLSISLSTLFWYQFIHFRLTYFFTHHFFLFWFTTLLIHYSLSL